MEDAKPEHNYLVGVTPEHMEIARAHPEKMKAYAEEDKPISPLIP